MNARELMSTNLVVVPPETPVIALAELLAARGISAAPVMGADGAPLGIVTEGDLIRRLADEKPSGAQWLLGSFRGSARQADRFVKTHGKTARDVMTTDLATATEDGVQLHQYGAYRVTTGDVALEVETAYPEDGEIAVRILADAEFALTLRIPPFARGTALLDGQAVRDHDDLGDAATWSAYVARIQQAADEHR